MTCRTYGAQIHIPATFYKHVGPTGLQFCPGSYPAFISTRSLYLSDRYPATYPNTRRYADESSDDAEKHVEQSYAEFPLLREPVDLHLECGKGGECTEEAHDHGHPQIISHFEFVGKQDQQQTDQERADNVYHERRERKLLEDPGERGDIDQVTRDRTGGTADGNRNDLPNSVQSGAIIHVRLRLTHLPQPASGR